MSPPWSAWCAVCDRWVAETCPDPCPLCDAPVGDVLALGLRVVVDRSADLGGFGWSRAQRFAGVIVAVRRGLDPCLDVARDDGVVVPRIYLGSTRPDTLAAREQAAVRAALLFAARL